MSYPLFPISPGFAGILVTHDPSFMNGSIGALIGTPTTFVPGGISGGGGLYRPQGGTNMDVMTAMLGTWTKPPQGGISAGIFWPLRFGKSRYFIATGPGGGS